MGKKLKPWLDPAERARRMEAFARSQAIIRSKLGDGVPDPDFPLIVEWVIEGRLTCDQAVQRIVEEVARRQAGTQRQA